jgi:hypothetical protein
MRQVLTPDMTFGSLRLRLADLGWTEERVPALLPPLIAGEPETAAFSRDGLRLDYRFNPALRLRVIEGPVPPDLPSLPVTDLPGMIRSPDPETALLGIAAAGALGQGDLRRLILLRATRLPAGLSTMALDVADRLAPLCAEACGFAALPSERQARSLRLAMKHHSPDTADLALVGLAAAPDIAATAMIAAARLGLTDLLPAFPRQAQGELPVAIRKLATATLQGQTPGPDSSPRNRFWRAMLGQGDPDMDLRLAPFVEPSPDLLPAEVFAGQVFRRIGAVPHWLGDADLPESARRHTPDPFLIAETPMATCSAAECMATLASLQASTGLRLRLPSEDELLCALRGTDGRLDPAGTSLRSKWQSPWGLLPGPTRREYCAVDVIVHSTSTDRSTTSRPVRIDDSSAGLRPVLIAD